MKSPDKTMMHGRDYAGQDVSGWWVSEKFDGCRAYWDGVRLWSRGGHVINAPAWLTEGLPALHLDCELWAGYGDREAARLACQYGRFTPACRLWIFDCPQATTGDWAARIKTAPSTRYASPVAFSVCRGRLDLARRLQAVLARRGEGLVLRKPGCAYTIGRVNTMLKVKAGFIR